MSCGVGEVTERLENEQSSTLAVSVPINICIELSFVSVNGQRKIDFLDTLRYYYEQLRITNLTLYYSMRRNIVKVTK